MFSKLVLYIMGVCVLVSCKENEVDKQTITRQNFGLENLTVAHMESYGDQIFATTINNNGLFKLQLPTDTPRWKMVGLKGKDISSFVAIDDDTWMVSIHVEAKIYKTDNQGASWDSIEYKIGGQKGIPLALLGYDSSTERLYGMRNDLIAYSDDLGKNWHPTYVDFEKDFGISNPEIKKMNPHNYEEVWVVGYTNLFYPVIVKSEDGGKSWKKCEILNLSSASINTLDFHPSDPNRVLIGSFKESLFQTVNGGDSWQTLLKDDWPKTIFASEYSKNYQNRIYCLMRKYDTINDVSNKLRFTDNNGETWRNEEFGEIQPIYFSSITNMISIPSTDREELLINFKNTDGVEKLTIYE